jgi:hypothetical protein
MPLSIHGVERKSFSYAAYSFSVFLCSKYAPMAEPLQSHVGMRRQRDIFRPHTEPKFGKTKRARHYRPILSAFDHFALISQDFRLALFPN